MDNADKTALAVLAHVDLAAVPEDSGSPSTRWKHGWLGVGQRLLGQVVELHCDAIDSQAVE